MQPGWKACPFCGAPIAPPTSSAEGVSITESVIKEFRQSSEVRNADGATLGGGFHINLGAAPTTGNAELEYERLVVQLLQVGGGLGTYRQVLDGQRVRLGLSIRVSREIEHACAETTPPPVVPAVPANPPLARASSVTEPLESKSPGTPRAWPDIDAEAAEWVRLQLKPEGLDGWFQRLAPRRRGEWLRAAEAGYAPAQWLIGRCFQLGLGAERDEFEAVRWYRRAAEQGHAAAQCNLGVMYENGEGVGKDATEAVRWYLKAAEQGHAGAQFNLGVSYVSAEGVGKDATEAVGWYLKAAEQGHAKAQFNLGLMYTIGEGVGKDATEAVRWCLKAAEQGLAKAQSNLGEMYENGEGVEEDHTEAVKWYTEAVKGYLKAAEQGHADAQFNLGLMYEKGTGVGKDATEAVRWYLKAAEQGHARAQSNLGEMYENGEGVEEDHTEAVKWYTKAAEQGSRLGKRRLLRLQSSTDRPNPFGRPVPATSVVVTIPSYQKSRSPGRAYRFVIAATRYPDSIENAQKIESVHIDALLHEEHYGDASEAAAVLVTRGQVILEVTESWMRSKSLLHSFDLKLLTVCRVTAPASGIWHIPARQPAGAGADIEGGLVFAGIKYGWIEVA